MRAMAEGKRQARWHPRRRNTTKYIAGRIERVARRALRRIPKIFQYAPIAMIIALLLSWPGFVVRTYGWLLVALSVTVDVWLWLLPKKTRWKWPIGWTAADLLLIGVMLLAYYGMTGVLSDQREDVQEKLHGEVQLPRSGDLLGSTFTVTNGGKTAIGTYRIGCGVALITSENRAVSSGNLVSLGTSTLPLLPNGDAQSTTCLWAARPAGRPTCADVRFILDYTLQTQPDVEQEKSFRFSSEITDGFGWHQIALSTPRSPCEHFR